MSHRLRITVFCFAAFLMPAITGGLLGLTAHAEAGPQVTVDNFSFGPARLIVKAGTTVTWTNQDDIPHTVVDSAAVRQFKSSALDTGDAFSHRFDSPGVFNYFCSLHPKMEGVIVVN